MTNPQAALERVLSTKLKGFRILDENATALADGKPPVHQDNPNRPMCAPAREAAGHALSIWPGATVTPDDVAPEVAGGYGPLLAPDAMFSASNAVPLSDLWQVVKSGWATALWG